ncbi:MAG: ABC transporter permease [Anaerolineae bacterium]|nr:ABC transporter permease [Anaerolineae bacterium]MCO5196526.1 ABC transporter permease [Anaerolineae bacterium]
MKTPPTMPQHTRRSRFRWLFAIAGGLLAAFLIVPLAAVVWQVVMGGSFAGLDWHAVRDALWLSLVTSIVVVIISLLLGTPLAYSLARWQFRFNGWLTTLTSLPIVLPPSVAGLALLIAFGRNGLLGRSLDTVFGLTIPFTLLAVILAQLFVSAPFYVRAARSTFVEQDLPLEEAAVLAGASEWQVFRFILIPLGRRSLLGGIILCWARALGEFGATLIFAGNLPGRTQTMPLAIYVGLENNIEGALLLALLLIMLAAILIHLLWRLEQNGSDD